ncbi:MULTISPECIES: M10 family metallopeptidase [unclassified Rhizobium]|uniref:M10 family metallopeptidase n=1 Tax=unclassified Rhizobium TaxID=2613769 RepID=UPI0007156FBA|nr:MULTISPECIES: M10 family metallopeptidase [unclassified Rhizobium]KQS96593.1 hypothetical protein ASG50_06025 [Rhizobium sp. Leaf386]KQT06432.1 hypothetical protein ASG42_02270 [Rhizobium sp. Leaf391]KQT92503.1 hypothetical protein ASG68_17025 [Rhizobium sp. Leaf453]
MATKKSFNTTQAAFQLTRNDSSWSVNLNEPTTITYAYRNSIPTNYEGSKNERTTFEKFTAAQIKVTELVFNLFEEVCGVTLKRVEGSNGYSNSATFLLGNYSDPKQARTYGYSYSVGDEERRAGSTDGDFWYNLSGPNDDGGDPKIPIGSDNYNTLIHELGHSLGLEHPSDYPEDFNYKDDAFYIQDSLQYTVMSYMDASETGAVHKGQFLKTLGLHDIAAMQRLYGANMTTRTGDDTYGFGGKSVYAIKSATDKTVFSIWDAGGKDTLNFSGYTNTQVINLNAEKFSSTGGLKYNISIAKGVTIENAVGGSGKDTITGNKVANVIDGGAGNDIIDGKEGNDTIKGGAGADILDGGTGNDKLTGGSGADSFFFGSVALAKLGLDLILDFAKGDKVVLDAATFVAYDASDDGLIGIAKGDFSAGTSLKSMGKGDHLFFDTDDSWIYYDNDGAGTGSAAIKFIELVNSYVPTYSDFLIA